MCSQVTNWFTKTLSYQYDPGLHGNVAEWLSDLISISFTKPPKYFKRSMRSIKVPQHACCTVLAVACLLGDQLTVISSVHYGNSAGAAYDAQSSCSRPYCACNKFVDRERHVGKQPHSSSWTLAELIVDVAPPCLNV